MLSFLSIEGSYSSWLDVTLGPLLFLIYTDDIANYFSPGIYIALFADEAKYFAPFTQLITAKPFNLTYIICAANGYASRSQAYLVGCQRYVFGKHVE